ncbi:unnamed protein product [Effrenium voratum]|nr:unnamed protein product [Effrenium voratum]
MAGVADSEATFSANALKYGLSQGILDHWKGVGIRNYSSLLFTVASSPGNVDSDKLEKLLGNLPAGARNTAVEAAVSRLLFEGGTFVVAELKQSVEHGDESTQRLSPQERSSRLAAVRAKLGASPVTGQFEPSHRLSDMCATMVRDQAIRHIPPSSCSCREQEIASVKQDDNLFRLESNSLKAASKPAPLEVDLSTELRMYQAFARRGIALEVAGVCSFETHEAYARSLFDHLSRPAPAGYVAPGAEQILRADRALWQAVAEDVEHRFANSGGATLVDAAIKKHQSSAVVTFHVLPLVKPERSEKKRSWDDAIGGKDGKGGKGQSKSGKGKWQGQGRVRGQRSLPPSKV